MIELEVVRGVAQGSKIATNAPCITIGRSQAGTIIISDPNVSRYHGEIVPRGESYQYRDLNSTYGTVLRRGNVERSVERVQLKVDDELLIAKSENVIRVNRIAALAEDVSDEFTLTVEHESEEKLGAPEEIFASDSQALRAILRLDKAILSPDMTHGRELLSALMDHILEIYPELDYVAIVQRNRNQVFIDQCGFLREGVIPRTSSRIIRIARKKKGGIVFEISGAGALSTESRHLDLSSQSTTLARDTTGICVPLFLDSGEEKYLQLEHELLHGRFTQRDLYLVGTMVPRVVGRINHLQLGERYVSISQNAAVGIFAKMIAHDIKGYLAFADYVGEKLENPEEHTDIVKGVSRARRLALGMENLSGSATKPITQISLVEISENIVAEFSSLFRDRCSFEAIAPKDIGNITTSEELLYRVLWNLVMNAYHAFGNRDPSITDPPFVRVRLESKAKNDILIHIEDNAGGIGPQTLRYLISSFALTKKVYDKKEDLIRVVEAIHGMKGFTNRVGLFFTAVAVNDMRGNMSFFTELGKGTTVTVQLPRTIDALRDLLKF